MVIEVFYKILIFLGNHFIKSCIYINESKNNLKLFNKTYKTEKELIQGCIRQKGKAQEQLYKLYSGKMMSVCLRYLKDIEDAEESLSNAFIIIFQKIEQTQEGKSLEGWIRKIVVNTCLQKLRTQKTDFLYLDDLSKEPVKTEVELNFESEEIFRAIKSLPSGYRTVFNLYAVENYKHNEIAEALNISIGTSKSQYSKAKNMLKNTLKKEKIAKNLNHENSI